jgi:Glycosyltransferase family 9 (heptosyltransferase)
MSMNSGETELGEIDKPRVCVLFPGALGDFVCFLPALRQLANARAVDLLARSEFAAIAPPGVRVRSLERPEVHYLFIDGGATEPCVSQFYARYTAIYSWFASQQSVFVDQLQKAAQGRAQIFPFRPDKFTLHQADYCLTCLDSKASMTTEPLVELAADALLWCDNFVRCTEIGRAPFLVMAPGSGSQGKNWPEVHYLHVAHWWREQFGGKVVAVIGPVEAERHGFEHLSSCCQVASGLDLAQLAALIARCDVYVGNDSGVSHLAAAVGARTVALFGPSNERQWAPRGPRVSILRRQIACSPCGDTAMKLCPHRACLTELSPEEVIQELRKLPEIANLTRLGAGITV